MKKSSKKPHISRIPVAVKTLLDKMVELQTEADSLMDMAETLYEEADQLMKREAATVLNRKPEYLTTAVLYSECKSPVGLGFCVYSLGDPNQQDCLFCHQSRDSKLEG